MTKQIERRFINKNCQGCAKLFAFDPNIRATRKFCSRDCYWKFLNAPVSKSRIRRFLNFFRFFVLILFCFECLQENILFKSIIENMTGLECNCEVFAMPDDLELDLLIGK